MLRNDTSDGSIIQRKLFNSICQSYSSPGTHFRNCKIPGARLMYEGQMIFASISVVCSTYTMARQPRATRTTGDRVAARIRV